MERHELPEDPDDRLCDDPYIAVSVSVTFEGVDPVLQRTLAVAVHRLAEVLALATLGPEPDQPPDEHTH